MKKKIIFLGLALTFLLTGCGSNKDRVVIPIHSDVGMRQGSLIFQTCDNLPPLSPMQLIAHYPDPLLEYTA